MDFVAQERGVGMRRLIALLLVLMVVIPSISLAASTEPVTILLLGTDDLGLFSVTGTEEMSRSDALFVVTLQPATGAIKLLSVERDYLVVLPDDLGENKLSTSSYFGGPEMAMGAINSLFELDVSYYAHIDITNVIKAIDIIGGGDVEIDADEVDEVNAFIDGILSHENLSNVKAGMNHLNGPEAWAFLGVRNNDIDTVESNAARNDRQRRVLTACLDKFFQMGSTEAMKLAQEILPLIKTNLTMSNVLSLITTALACDFEKISYLRSPHGSYQNKRVNMHKVIVPDDMPAEIQTVKEFLYQ